MLQKLLVATQNPGKMREMRSALEHNVRSLLFLSDLPDPLDDLPETGSTYRENAEQKAVLASQMTGMPTLTDDSGIEVAALEGFPGVHSARWLTGSDADRVSALLQKLDGEENRSARFVCSMCLCQPGEPAIFFEGIMEGSIAIRPSGNNGFGYDPIFIPTGASKSLGELDSDYKQRHSHRAVALRKVQQFLKTK